MNKRQHLWFLIAIIFLYIATFIGFWQSQQNLNEHEKLDQQSCQRALLNRKILSDLVETLTHDPNVTLNAESKNELEKLDKELHNLIYTVHNCQESS